MKFLLDMNIPTGYAALLNQAGYEAVRWNKIGKNDASDMEIMEYAHKHNYIVVTFDLDFGTLLATTRSTKPSVLQIRAAILDAKTAINAICFAIKSFESELEAGAIVTIDLKKSRVRLLPL